MFPALALTVALTATPPTPPPVPPALAAWVMAAGMGADMSERWLRQECGRICQLPTAPASPPASPAHPPTAGSSSSSSSSAARRVGSGVEQWRTLVASHFPAEHVDLALAVMACESGGNPDARNPNSSASGLFQHLARYWDARTLAAGIPGASIFDPTSQMVVTAHMTGGGVNWTAWQASHHCWH